VVITEIAEDFEEYREDREGSYYLCDYPPKSSLKGGLNTGI